MKGNSSEISQTALYRISALVLLVAAALVTAGNLLGPQGRARGAVASGMYYPAAFIVLFGGLLVMAGLPPVYLRQRVESGVLGFLSIPGGGGIHMSWWWATTGTFGVIAYMVALAWFAIELLQSVGQRRQTQ